jgi:hypothetical protein
MSAIFNNSTSKYLDASSLTGLSTSSGRILVCAWTKWDGTTLGSVQTMAQLCETSGDAVPGMELYFSISPRITANTNGTTHEVATTFSSATWVHGAASFGPWDGSSKNRRAWYNGNPNQTPTTPTAASTTLSYLVVGRRNTAAASMKGRIAQVGVWAGLTTTDEDAIVAAAQLYNVDTISPAPNYAWRLNNAVTAAVGGIDLTNNGTVTFDGADNPSLTDFSGGGSNVLIASCFM